MVKRPFTDLQRLRELYRYIDPRTAKDKRVLALLHDIYWTKRERSLSDYTRCQLDQLEEDLLSKKIDFQAGYSTATRTNRRNRPDVRKKYRFDGDLRTLDIVAMLTEENSRGETLAREINEDKHMVTVMCPWFADHSGVRPGDNGDRAAGPIEAFIFYGGENRSPGFKCHLDHCVGRGIKAGRIHSIQVGPRSIRITDQELNRILRGAPWTTLK